MKLFLTIIACTIPVILWGIYFHKKNPRKITFRETLLIFLTGTFSAIPILIFHNYLKNDIVRYIQDIFLLDNDSIYLSILMIFLIGSFIALFTIFFALIKATTLYLFYGLPWLENFRTIKKSFYSLTPLLLLLLLFLLLELITKQISGIDLIKTTEMTLILFVILEEYCKYMINPFLTDKRPESISATVINAIYVGLAFSFIENIVFLQHTSNFQEYAAVFIYRSMITMPMHICASGILGYFYGLSLFSKSIATSFEVEKAKYKKLYWITEGFFAAALLHSAYNLLINYGDRIFSSILVVCTTALIIYILNLKSSQLCYGLVGTEWMPDKDFHDLKLKISVMEHLKQIQEKTKKDTVLTK